MTSRCTGRSSNRELHDESASLVTPSAVEPVFAAGLAGKAVHELRGLIGWETGYLVSSAWTVDAGIWSAGGTFYDFMKGLFGWHANPERIRVIAYFVYLIPVLALYLRGPKAEKQLAS